MWCTIETSQGSLQKRRIQFWDWIVKRMM